MTEYTDESIAKLGAMIDANTSAYVRLRAEYDDLLCSVKVSMYFMDQARTPWEMRAAVGALKEALAKAEKEQS